MNEQINQNPNCKSCASTRVRKYGLYKGVQRYYCKVSFAFGVRGAYPLLKRLIGGIYEKETTTNYQEYVRKAGTYVGICFA